MAMENPLISAFNPVLIIHYCFGTANLLKIQRFQVLYAFFVVGCMVLNLALFVKCLMDTFEDINRRPLMTAIIDIATILGLEMAALTFHFQAFLRLFSNQRNNIFQYLDQIDSEFNYQLKTSFNYDALRRDVIISIAISLLLSIILQTTAILSKDCESVFCSMHRFFCTTNLVYGNITFLCLLKELLRRVNRMNTLLKSNSLLQRNSKELKVEKLMKTRQSEIKFFSKIHTNCYLAIECLNKSFGYSHITTFGFCFYVLTCYIFYVFITFSASGPYSLNSTLYPLAITITVMAYMLKVTLTCEEITRENENLSHRIHKMDNNAAEMLNHNQEANIDLEMVSHQLLHQKLVFCTHDFFDIDLKFLNMMVGAVTTYLIILLQFGV